MKTNLFKVKKIDKNEIVMEEEQSKSFMSSFFKRHKNLFTIIFTILGVSILGLGLGLTISLVGNTTDFDITYIYGSGTVETNDADDEEVEKELLGNIAITDGVVLVTKKFLTDNGDIVTYYSDGTSLIITSKGTIKRVVAKEDGSYGVSEDGKIDSSVIRKVVTSSSSTLKDGTSITYYSDGSAEVTKNSLTIFIRKSANIVFNEKSVNQLFKLVNPSLVSVASKTTNVGNFKYTEFLNGSVLVEKDEVKYIVHNEDDISINGSSYIFGNNNYATVKSTLSLDDGCVVDYYSDGSAIITDKNNDKIVVRKSGDISIKDNKIYEIVPQEVAYAMSITNCSDGMTVTYYDDGSAVIRKQNGVKEYVEDGSKIKYDHNKNISSVDDDRSLQLLQRVFTNGAVVTNFDNGKSQVLEPDGRNYIIATSELKYDMSGNLISNSKVQDGDNTSSTSVTSETKETSKTSKAKKSRVIPDEEVDLDMTEVEAEPDYDSPIKYNSFNIINNNKYARKFKLVIEEVKDYSKFNATPIGNESHESATFVFMQATLGNTIIKPVRLSTMREEIEPGTNTYLIYEGVLGAKSTLKVSVILYVDYEPLDNSYQDKSFLGTLKLYYVDDDAEDSDDDTEESDDDDQHDNDHDDEHDDDDHH